MAAGFRQVPCRGPVNWFTLGDAILWAYLRGAPDPGHLVGAKVPRPSGIDSPPPALDERDTV